MRIHLLAGAVAALALAGSAQAADLYKDSGLKDAPVAPGVFLPTGAYVSVGAGGALTDTGITQHGFSGSDFNFAGFLGEARFGYDIRPVSGSPWIVGVFAGVSYEGLGGHIKAYSSSSYTPPSVSGLPKNLTAAQVAIVNSFVAGGGIIDAKTVGGLVTAINGVSGGTHIGVSDLAGVVYTPGIYEASSYNTTDSNQDLGWEAGIRVGRVFNDSSLLYGLAAYQGQQLSINNTGLSTTLAGVKLGAGLEIDLKDKWFFGSEVDWVWYGDWNPATKGIEGIKFSEDELRATAKIGRRF